MCITCTAFVLQLRLVVIIFQYKALQIVYTPTTGYQKNKLSSKCYIGQEFSSQQLLRRQTVAKSRPEFESAYKRASFRR